MRIIKLKGGLGNQLFQYSFAKLIERETGDIVKIDLSSYQALTEDQIRKPRILKYNISLPIATERDIKEICKFNHNGNSQSNRYRVGIALESILNCKYYFEKDRAYRNVKTIASNLYFDGYWQSYRYVDAVIEELERDFIPVDPLGENSKHVLYEIENTESVFIGIRRGDYLTVKPEHYGSLGQNYYDAGMKYIADRIPNAIFYIFSNDIEWVQKNMSFEKYNFVLVNDTEDDFEDYILMTRCKHSIIPNSTYHWWGARRHDNKEKIVVAPKKWFVDDAPIDIVPTHWKRE